MADLPQKPNRPAYQGSANLKNSVDAVKQNAASAVQNVTKDLNPEQKAEALGNAEAITRSAQAEVLAAPEPQRAAILEQKVKLLEQRASEENRGFSTGEKIAMAILRSAPIVAAALTPGADMRGAQQGSQQINSQFNDTLDREKQLKIQGIDKQLDMLSDDEKLALRGQERGEDKDFDMKKMDKQFQQQKYLESMKLKGDELKDKSAKEKYAQTKAKMFTNDALYKKSVSELASYDKGFTALMNENANGYSDIAGMFNFIKGLDESVVRPSEIELFNEARSLADRFTGFVQNKQTGEQFLKENRAKLAQVQGLLAKLPARYLNGMNVKATQGEDEETATKINTYLKRPEDILSIKTNALLKKELEKERLQDEAGAMPASQASVGPEQAAKLQRYQELKQKAGR